MSGCLASEVVNTGGDTKCKDFLTQDEKKQNDEVSKMLKDKSGQDPTNLEITATKASITLYCQALGKEDTTISEAPHSAERLTAAVSSQLSTRHSPCRRRRSSPVRCILAHQLRCVRILLLLTRGVGRRTRNGAEL